MKTPKALKWMIPLIFVLALSAALAGIWPAEGTPYSLTNFRGETITINARGLYYWDTFSSAVQMKANDFVTLVVGLPLLLISFLLSLRGSLRGRLLLSGTLGFILYTYMGMCVGTAYNDFFLVYVALFSLSLFAFILSLQDIERESLPDRFSQRLPRGWIAGLFIFTALFLSMAWLGRILPTLIGDQLPVLENTTSMFIQAMDLGIIVPACILSAILLLLRQNSWGYLLASVAVMKFLTMGLAVSLMSFNMARNGVAISTVELSIFPIITLINLVLAVLLLASVQEEPSTAR